MADTFVMSARQAAELDFALERNGFTPADVKLLSSGSTLASVLLVLQGQAMIIPAESGGEVEGSSSVVINLNADPFVPEGWKVEEHKKGGEFTFDASQVKLHSDPGQQNGKYIQGHKLRKRLKNVPVMNAVLLDWYLANPQYIPDEWKGKFVFFWGTIYRDRSGDLYVRCLCWSGDRWSWSSRWLGDGWRSDDSAAVLASTQS